MTMLKEIVKLFVRTKKEPVDPAKESVEEVLRTFSDEGMKPSIDRTNDKWMGYGHEQTKGKKFIRVRNGHKVLYFGNPFWNLYRITGRAGTHDYVTHSVNK